MRVMSKLKALKKAIKVWNKEIIRNVHDRIASAQTQLQQIQSNIAYKGFTEDQFHKELGAHSVLESALRDKHAMLQD